MPLIESQHLNPFKLLPCRPDVCQECATDHEPDLPHNQQSMYYQYHFYNAHGRWPTWTDAMAHCSDSMKGYWKNELMAMGVTDENWKPSPPDPTNDVK